MRLPKRARPTVTEPASVLFNFDEGFGAVYADHASGKHRAKFSSVPVIRSFESLLTDDEFASAGLTVAKHPSKTTFYVYGPSSDFLVPDDLRETKSNTLMQGRYFVSPVNLLDLKTKSPSPHVDLRKIRDRIDELRALAKEEQLSFNSKSAAAALGWLERLCLRTLPHVFLLNSGNVRLLWRERGSQLGIQFREDGTAQFVFLGEDDQSEQIYGAVKTNDLTRRISGLDLFELIGFHGLSEDR